MTPAEWVAARRALLAKTTPGPWRWDEAVSEIVGSASRGEPDYAKAIVETDGGYYGPCESDRDLIVAAVNEQAKVLALVEAVAEMLQSWEDQSPCAEIRMRDAIDALVVGEP